MSLREKFIKLIDEYGRVFEEVNRTQNFKHSFSTSQSYFPPPMEYIAPTIKLFRPAFPAYHYHQLH